jgi:hypothetical protein
MMKTLLLISLAALMVAAPADAKKKAAKPKTAPAELKWLDGPPGLPAGAQFAVVKGDPTKKGMFTIRAKLPANYAVRPTGTRRTRRFRSSRASLPTA